MRAEHLKSIEKVNLIEHSFLRNMVWLIYCDQILTIEGFTYKFMHNRSIDSLIEWLSKIDHSVLPEVKDNLPLGKYAEELIKFYLSHNANYKLYSANTQLIKNGITLGELDFLFKDLHNSIHLEFSIKYYLKTRRKKDIIFLGPSTKDWMNRKVTKLINQQTQFSKLHKNMLPQALQKIEFTPKAIVKGCLFYDWKEWNMKENKDVLNQGWWIHIDRIEQIVNPDIQFSILGNKRDWIFPYNSTYKKITTSQLISFAQSHLGSTNELMVVRYNTDGIPIDRGFIMRKNWPK